MRRWQLWCFLAILLSGACAPALADPAADADLVLVRKDCLGRTDCFETLTAALQWTWGTRDPGPTDPLLMDIGAGIWDEPFYCDGSLLDDDGYLSVRGAGRDVTIITGGQVGSLGDVAAHIDGCTNMEFMDLEFRALDIGVFWSGDGTSTWTDVDIINESGGKTVGWYESNDCSLAGPHPVHYFFGSRIEAIGRRGFTSFVPATPYWSKCSETWFYGGEILWTIDENRADPGAVVALDPHSDFRVFGTAIRARVLDGVSFYGYTIGVMVRSTSSQPSGDPGPSSFHMHGGIISIDTGSSPMIPAVGVQVDGPQALAHLPETAVALNSAAFGKRIDVLNSGKVDWPFTWNAGPLPPKASGENGGVTSGVDGLDMFVETDCGANGKCNGAGTETHLMIYNSNCSPDPWFDVVTGACRDVSP